jgi:hypothetical protein
MLLERMDMWIKRGNCYPEYTRKRATSVNAWQVKKAAKRWWDKIKTKRQREGPKRRRWHYQIFSIKGHWKNNKESYFNSHNNREDIFGRIGTHLTCGWLLQDFFGPSPISSLILDGIECDQITKEDRLEMIKPFDMEEIKHVAFDLKHNKAAPWRDGFPGEFY